MSITRKGRATNDILDGIVVWYGRSIWMRTYMQRKIHFIRFAFWMIIADIWFWVSLWWIIKCRAVDNKSICLSTAKFVIEYYYMFNPLRRRFTFQSYKDMYIGTSKWEKEGRYIKQHESMHVIMFLSLIQTLMEDLCESIFM